MTGFEGPWVDVIVLVAVEPADVVALLVVLRVELDVVDPLAVRRYEGMFIPLVHVAKSTLQLFVVERHQI
jgi:hypothetical protein